MASAVYDATVSEGALVHELKMSVDDYLLEPTSDEHYGGGVKIHESARIVQGFACCLSIASDICEKRRNIIDLKALDPLFPPEKKRMPEFSLCIKITFHPHYVQVLPESRTPQGYVTVPAEHSTFYAKIDPAVSLPLGVHRLDHGNMYSAFDADGIPRLDVPIVTYSILLYHPYCNLIPSTNKLSARSKRK
jgi:hypothetical protein